MNGSCYCDSVVVECDKHAAERKAREDAFEAMRKALREVSEWYESEVPYREDNWNPGDRESWLRISRWRGALADADKVSKP